MTAVYVALADQYRKAIQRGELKPGYRFPTQPELAEEHGVVVSTVHRFMALLKKEGMVYTTHAGTYVGPRPADPRTSPAPPIHADQPKAVGGPGRKWVAEVEEFIAQGDWRLVDEIPAYAAQRMRVQCTRCGYLRTFNVAAMRKRPVCTHRSSANNPLTADELTSMLKEGGWRLAPGQGAPLDRYARLKVTCVECGQLRSVPVRRLTKVQCSHHASPRKPVTAQEAEATLKEHGYVPVDPYPGTAHARWVVKCIECGQHRQIPLSTLRAHGRRCHHVRTGTLAPEEAAREMRTYGYEPMEPYPGKAGAVWRVRCTECGKPRRQTLSMARIGRRCRHGEAGKGRRARG